MQNHDVSIPVDMTPAPNLSKQLPHPQHPNPTPHRHAAGAVSGLTSTAASNSCIVSATRSLSCLALASLIIVSSSLWRSTVPRRYVGSLNVMDGSRAEVPVCTLDLCLFRDLAARASSRATWRWWMWLRR